MSDRILCQQRLLGALSGGTLWGVVILQICAYYLSCSFICQLRPFIPSHTWAAVSKASHALCADLCLALDMCMCTVICFCPYKCSTIGPKLACLAYTAGTRHIYQIKATSTPAQSALLDGCVYSSSTILSARCHCTLACAHLPACIRAF